MSKCIMVAIAGLPNVGKSTFINSALGSKISIVTPKVQTTRFCVRGVLMRGGSQIVLIDTPGLFAKRKNAMESAMMSGAFRNIAGTDATLLFCDPQKDMHNYFEPMIEKIAKITPNIILVINKVDKIRRDRLFSVVERYYKVHDFQRCFMISSLRNDGVDDVLSYLQEIAPEGPYLYPLDQKTDLTDHYYYAEITREKIFLALQEELPYNTFVHTVEIQDQRSSGGRLAIGQHIITTSENHKQIILGKGGEMIKHISMTARHELEDIIGSRIDLFVNVKVEKNWNNRKELLALSGLGAGLES